MKNLLVIFLGLFLPGTIVASALGQCTGVMTTVYYNSYAIRYGASAYTSTSTYVGGGDALYTTVTLTQVDKLNGIQTLPNIVKTSLPGGSIAQSRLVNINTQGFGTYSTQGFFSATDQCTGRVAPPFDTGVPYTNVASFYISRPYILGDTTRIFIHPLQVMPGAYTNTGFPPITNIASLSIYAPGITNTVAGKLVFSGNTQAIIKLSEVSNNTDSTTVAASATATASCTAQVQVSATIDGLIASPLGLKLVDASSTDATSPSTNNHVDNLAITGTFTGYESDWYFQAVDTCGYPLPFVQGYEMFPNGFTPDYANTNWSYPIPNTYYVGAEGGWYDAIGFKVQGQAIPQPTVPQNPLNGTRVFEALQKVNIGPYTVYTATQVHYIDHGGYTGILP